MDASNARPPLGDLRARLSRNSYSAIFGGRFDAGPAGAGFRVAARLPLDREPSAA